MRQQGEDIVLNDSEKRTVQYGRRCWKKIQGGAHREDNFGTGRALLIGREWAARKAGQPVEDAGGRGYNTLFSLWLGNNHFDGMHPNTRSDLIFIADNEVEIRKLLVKLERERPGKGQALQTAHGLRRAYERSIGVPRRRTKLSALEVLGMLDPEAHAALERQDRELHSLKGANDGGQEPEADSRQEAAATAFLLRTLAGDDMTVFARLLLAALGPLKVKELGVAMTTLPLPLDPTRPLAGPLN